MQYKIVVLKLRNDQEKVLLLPAQYSLAEAFDWQAFVDSENNTMWINSDHVLFMKEKGTAEKYWQ